MYHSVSLLIGKGSFESLSACLQCLLLSSYALCDFAPISDENNVILYDYV